MVWTLSAAGFINRQAQNIFWNVFSSLIIGILRIKSLYKYVHASSIVDLDTVWTIFDGKS